jgi:N6-adenosine-specific RNA methylase IME4
MATGRAQSIVRAWGAEPVTELVWIKTTRTGKVRMGPGYRARTMHEPILLAKYGNPKHEPFPSSFTGLARRHSEKPAEFDKIVIARTLGVWRANLYSAGIERPGFEGWGEDHRTEEALEAHGARQGSQRGRTQPSSFFGTEV